MTLASKFMLFMAAMVLIGTHGCALRTQDYASVTKSRLHALEQLGVAAIEKQKGLDGITTIAAFVDLMKTEAEGASQQYIVDQWGSPFLFASVTKDKTQGILFVSLGSDVADERDDLRLWIVRPGNDKNDIYVSRSWADKN
jgi:hypothetical protein